MLGGVRSPLCVGDRVRFLDDPDDTPVITALLPRRNQVARVDSHNRALLHIFAANVDRLVIVASLGIPELRPGLIDRYLIAAHIDDIEPLVVINKCDLGDSQAIAGLYRQLGYQVFCTCAGPHPTLDGLDAAIAERTCVFAGQSGVGKSSLIKAIAGDLDIRIGDVSTIQHKGRHTTTSARSYPLGQGATLIDTPGIREFAIPELDALDVALLYRDLAAHHHECRFPNCTHVHEPACAVQAAVAAGTIARTRYESYLSIISDDLGNQ